MSDFPLWDLAPDSRSLSRTFVAKDFAEGEVFTPCSPCDSSGRRNGLPNLGRTCT
ncbi:hypothetical protein M758_7G082600 [Ceratodon purpureus]|uniref:Uncharacterized protein n=1 Tax=Ceratodon purpureus TaxID=3225 RepID=A0A8T0H9F7_CERPU|nr:hypothetical protein KC19_7G087700 [Ceratodon purpureus]KAG0566819.1 hypothetical protein KC19_7G090000 [Ceratodon purpureus]KAG0566829.1 hypothetical protein KC19_7G090900 [Ceratodon purpureus]KAG0610666.1 hypothetical protein M758_7G082600 [Ceratodon purpureus]